MGFIFKSVFWLLVVAAFLPRDLEAHASTGPAPLSASVSASAEANAEPTPDAPLIDAGATVDRFCEGRREVCAAGEEAAIVARAAGRFAVARASRSLAASEAGEAHN